MSQDTGFLKLPIEKMKATSPALLLVKERECSLSGRFLCLTSFLDIAGEQRAADLHLNLRDHPEHLAGRDSCVLNNNQKPQQSPQ